MGRNGCAVIPDQEHILHPKREKDDEVLKDGVDLSISSEFEKMRHRDGVNLDHAWAHDHPHASSKANLEFTTEHFKAHEVQPVFCRGRRNCKAERERITKLTNSMTIKGPSVIVFFARRSNYALRISKDIALHFLPKYDKKAILIDFLGEKWPIRWRWKATEFSCGWKRFYQHHHLSIDHACMIELVNAESLTLKVTIFSPETRPNQQVEKMELQEITCPKDRFNHDSSKTSLLKKWIKSFPSYIFQWSNRWRIILKDSVLMLE